MPWCFSGWCLLCRATPLEHQWEDGTLCTCPNLAVGVMSPKLPGNDRCRESHRLLSSSKGDLKRGIAFQSVRGSGTSDLGLLFQAIAWISSMICGGGSGYTPILSVVDEGFSASSESITGPVTPYISECLNRSLDLWLRHWTGTQKIWVQFLTLLLTWTSDLNSSPPLPICKIGRMILPFSCSVSVSSIYIISSSG